MENEIKLFICGDVMPGGVLPYQDSYIDDEVKCYMASFDYRVGTLECAIGTNLKPAPEKLKINGGNDNVCFARDEDFFRIKELGFNAMSLGNNHSFDLGEEGLKNAMRHLRDSGIGYFGAGMNKLEASNPFVVELGGKTIAIIGCCIKGLPPKSLIVATETTFGVYQPTIEELLSQIRSLSGKYDYLFVMPHWGEEHVRVPAPVCINYARRMIDAGADGVFGSHSHCLSAYTTYKGKPIYYGMGNFLDPDKCLTPPRPFFYPKSSEEVIAMPRCINYPWSIKRPTLMVCGEDSRLGFAVRVKIGKNIETNVRIVNLGSDNVLRWYGRCSSLKYLAIKYLVLPFINMMTQSLLYGYIYRVIFRYERKLRNLYDFRRHL